MIHFRQLKNTHPIFASCNILDSSDTVYAAETEIMDGLVKKPKTFIYWVHGDGLVPLHKEKDLKQEFDARIQLKKFLRAI